jgi:outer membrane lipoprotein-sorting protein
MHKDRLKMTKYRVWAAVLVGCVLASHGLVGNAATLSAQEILAASDAVRNPDYAFGVTTTLIEYRAGKQTDTNTLLVYSKSEQSSGKFRTLIRFVQPVRDANKLMLKNGNEVWFYDPANKASIRISPQQRLLGQAANGDVVTVNLAKDYKASLASEEDVDDGDRQRRHCYKLSLDATSADVTYPRIEMWIDETNNHPLKARFYTDSGRLLKTAYYRRYQNELGGVRPTETVIIDGLDTGWVTVMRGSDYVKRDVPDAWFQRDYLSHFNAE